MKRLFTSVLLMIILVFSASVASAVPLNQIYQIIEGHTVDPVNSTELRKKTLGEIAEYLNDPYFTYLPPDIFQHYLESHQGYFAGIGITISKQDGKILIVGMYSGTPAAKAGVLVGDEIVGVDGVDVRGFTGTDAALLLKGALGSKVTLTVVRAGVEFTFVMVRDVIHIPTVHGYIEDNVAVMEITSFTSQTAQEFRTTLKSLRLKLPDGLVIDLRGNPGGTLSSVLEVAQELVPAGPIVRLRGSRGQETVLLSEKDPAPMPFLVVLTDEESASAAEILAGAVQDSGAGLIIGHKSYGKGTAQSVFLLSDGGGLRLTTNRFYTPLGKPINGIGIQPNIEIYSKDAQRKFAITMVKANAERQMTFTIGQKNVWVSKNIIQAEHPPFIANDRSYIPLRLLAQSMGYLVEWDDESFTATLRQGMNEIEIPLRKDVIFLNGNPFYLKDPILIRESRSFLPARAIAEALGSQVYWNHDARQVTVRW